MKGRWTERTEGRTASANGKGKSQTKRARGAVRREREAKQEELEGSCRVELPPWNTVLPLSTPHTQSSASQVIKWISCLVLSERT